MVLMCENVWTNFGSNGLLQAGYSRHVCLDTLAFVFKFYFDESCSDTCTFCIWHDKHKHWKQNHDFRLP